MEWEKPFPFAVVVWSDFIFASGRSLMCYVMFSCYCDLCTERSWTKSLVWLRYRVLRSVQNSTISRGQNRHKCFMGASRMGAWAYPPRGKKKLMRMIFFYLLWDMCMIIIDTSTPKLMPMIFIFYQDSWPLTTIVEIFGESKFEDFQFQWTLLWWK